VDKRRSVTVSYDEKPGIQAIKNIAANLLRHSRAGGNPEGEMTQPCYTSAKGTAPFIPG